MADTYSPSEVKELTEFALAVNEALLRNDTADFVSAGGGMVKQAFLQHIFEVYQFKTITADAWFNSDDGYRGKWAEQIKSVKEAYDKADGDESVTEAAQDASAELAELKKQFAALEAKVDETTKEDAASEDNADDETDKDSEDKPADEGDKPEAE